MQLIALLKEVKPKKDSALEKFKYREFPSCIQLYKSIVDHLAALNPVSQDVKEHV